MSVYRLAIYAKLKLMREYKSDNPSIKIREEYDKIAEDIISKYKDK